MSKRKLAITFAALGLIGLSGGLRAETAVDRAQSGLSAIAAEDTGLPAGTADEAARILSAGPVTPARVARVLKLLYPDFALQCRNLGEGKPQARAGLEGYLDHENPWLAAEASYVLGRASLGAERYEEAADLLGAVNTRLAGHSLRVGESLYYQGLSQAHALRREEAIDSLLTFLGFHGDAAPGLLASARDRVEQLEGAPAGDLADVARHMDYAGSKLALADAGVATRQVQGRIIDMLDELIRIAEQPPG